MKISDIRLRLVSKEGDKLKAVASITVEDCIVIHDIKVIEGKEGLFISMPNKKYPDGSFKDIVHPNKSEIRKEIQDAVLASYNEALKAE